MLDIVFALSVLAAVVFFGALLSVGNERQRKAIDGIREQAVRWSEQDLRLKRARAASQLHVLDARTWMNTTSSRLLGTSPSVLALNLWEKDGLKALVCPCRDGRKLVVTPVPPVRFLPAVRVKGRSRLAQAEVGLLGDHPKRLPVYEMNIVTCGPFFDQEARLAWKQATGNVLEIDRLYLFEVLPMHKPQSPHAMFML